jgi:serine/threonine protein kinase
MEEIYNEKLIRELEVKSELFLGAGKYGKVFKYNENEVIKIAEISKDELEVLELLKLNKHENICNIIYIYSNKTYKDFYVMEKADSEFWYYIRNIKYDKRNNKDNKDKDKDYNDNINNSNNDNNSNNLNISNNNYDDNNYDDINNNIFLNICEGLLFLQKNNICHFDLTSRNIMIKNNKPIIIDFSVSQITDKNGKVDDCLYYCLYPPYDFYDNINGFKIDNWMLVSLYFCILYNRYIFYDNLCECKYEPCISNKRLYEDWLREEYDENDKNERFFTYCFKNSLDAIPPLQDIKNYFIQNIYNS